MCSKCFVWLRACVMYVWCVMCVVWCMCDVCASGYRCDCINHSNQSTNFLKRDYVLIGHVMHIYVHCTCAILVHFVLLHIHIPHHNNHRWTERMCEVLMLELIQRMHFGSILSKYGIKNTYNSSVFSHHSSVFTHMYICYTLHRQNRHHMWTAMVRSNQLDQRARCACMNNIFSIN